MNPLIHLAILPFKNLNDGDELDYFSDGLSEGIINKLSLIDGLRVTSRTSSFRYKSSKASYQEIGQSLHVVALIEGSVQLLEENLMISANLITVHNDEIIWSDSWTQGFKNIFKIQSELSDKVAEKLREYFGHFDYQGLEERKESIDIEAYKNYLKGNYHYLKWNFKDVNNAIIYFDKALSIDPQFAEPYVGLANCYTFLGGTGYIGSEDALSKADDYANKALKMGLNTPELYFALAGKYFWKDWNLQGTFYTIKKALQLNPSYAETQSLLGLVYALIGKPALAQKHVNIALRLDPFSSNKLFTKAWISYLSKDYETALTFSSRALKKDPELIPAIFIKACSMMLSGNAQKLIQNFEKDQSKKIDEATRLGTLALGNNILGRLKKADEYSQLLLEDYQKNKSERNLAFLFLVSAHKGEEQAIQWLQRAFETRLPLLLFLISDPLVEPISSHPDFLIIKNKLLTIQGLQIDLGRTPKNTPDGQWAQQHQKQLIDHFKEKQPYLNPTISLRSLAQELDISPNLLSWLINNRFGQNFNEFINHYRVEIFKQKARDPENANLTLLGLAYECGFNSKTSFNTIFKRETGMTPKAYLKQLS